MADQGYESLIFYIKIFDMFEYRIPKVVQNPSGLIINPSGWDEEPQAQARAPKLVRGAGPGPGLGAPQPSRKDYEFRRKDYSATLSTVDPFY